VQKAKGLTTAGVTAALLLYLFAWPVPIKPVTWEAPFDTGLVYPYEANDRLKKARLIDLGPWEGPEDIAGGPDGLIYTVTSDGKIIRFDSAGQHIEVFATPGGRPLGIEFDTEGNLLVANAYLGLQKISRNGVVSILVDSYMGEAIVYADDVAIANDGSIYFSDASSKFGARDSGGTYAASLLDMMEHGGHGRVFRYEPTSGKTTVLVDGLNFANGVAVSTDQQFLLINETGNYRVWRYWLAGPDAGTREVILDDLPGFPDNINNGLEGRFWIGLVAPRSSQLDGMARRPWLRKLVQRLPAAIRPKAEPSSHVLAISGDGEVLMNLQDRSAQLPALTGVYETQETLWLTSLFGHRLGMLEKRNLAPRRDLPE
jgi:sugar lactone lactonase YvrE